MKLKNLYQKEIVPKMMKKFGFKNRLAVPKIEKVVINVGINKKKKDNDPKYVEKVVDLVSQITGQRPKLSRAQKSVAGFNIRQGEVVGVNAILRGEKKYSFLEKVYFIALPRTRDFRGINPKSVDKGGNLSIGFDNQMAFPEINPEEVDKTFPLQMTITTSTQDRNESLELLRLLKTPFKVKKDK